MEFKEQTIFEFEKDNSFTGSREFKRKIKDKYGLLPSSELYRRITNYQIRKYGEPLSGSKINEYIPKGSINRNFKKRRQETEYSREKKKTDRIVERLNYEKN